MSVPQVDIPPFGPIRAPANSWEGYHFHRWGNVYWPYWNSGQPWKWVEFSFWLPSPLDNFITGTFTRFFVEDVFTRVQEGGPVQAAIFYKAHRVAGIPYKWDYFCHIEYHESPALPIVAIIGGVIAVLFAVLGVNIAINLIGAGIIPGGPGPNGPEPKASIWPMVAIAAILGGGVVVAYMQKE